MELTGGQILVKYLEKEPVPYILGIPGHGILAFFDAVREADAAGNIKYLQVKHEQAAVHIADGYFRVSGQPLAVFTSIGPGALNTAIGLGTAYVDSCPVFQVSGDTHVRMKGVGVLQEIAGLSESGFWKGDPVKAGGGALMDMAAHKFATIEYVLDARCTRVTAQLAKQAINLPEKAEDNAIAIASFDNGAIADIMVSFTQLTTPYNSMEIFGDKGSIFENHAWENPVRYCSFDERMGENRQKWLEPDIEHAAFPEYYTISVRETDEHFARCILENREPEFTSEQSMSAITGILAGYLSAIEGRPVDTAEIEQMADEERGMEILERLAPAIPINRNLEKVRTMEPIGYDKKRAAAIMKKYDLDLLVASSPVNVFYLSGLPLLHCADNPILLALNNQYPNLAMIRGEGEGTIVHWNVFKSTGRFSWIHDAVGIESQHEAGQALASKIRKWGLAGNPPAHVGAGGHGQGGPDGVLRTAGDSGHERSHSGAARRAAHRRSGPQGRHRRAHHGFRGQDDKDGGVRR